MTAANFNCDEENFTSCYRGQINYNLDKNAKRQYDQKQLIVSIMPSPGKIRLMLVAKIDPLMKIMFFTSQNA